MHTRFGEYITARAPSSQTSYYIAHGFTIHTLAIYTFLVMMPQYLRCPCLQFFCFLLVKVIAVRSMAMMMSRRDMRKKRRHLHSDRRRLKTTLARWKETSYREWLHRRRGSANIKVFCWTRECDETRKSSAIDYRHLTKIDSMHELAKIHYGFLLVTPPTVLLWTQSAHNRIICGEASHLNPAAIAEYVNVYRCLVRDEFARLIECL